MDSLVRFSEINQSKPFDFHLMLSNQKVSEEDRDYSIDYCKSELESEFPWISVIERDLTHPQKQFQHDGDKLKKCILEILDSE